MAPHIHPVQIYYEDTDHSGVVYHANYLKYFERAREHFLGVPELVRMWEQDGVGFVVYKVTMQFRKGARFGDTVEIRSTARLESEYRVIFEQAVWRADVPTALVEATIEMVAVNSANQLVKIPTAVIGMAGAT